MRCYDNDDNQDDDNVEFDDYFNDDAEGGDDEEDVEEDKENLKSLLEVEEIKEEIIVEDIFTTGGEDARAVTNAVEQPVDRKDGDNCGVPIAPPPPPRSDKRRRPERKRKLKTEEQLGEQQLFEQPRYAY